ncbi:MAG: PaaI family thioesterase [Acidimicrobiales bacterium]
MNDDLKESPRRPQVPPPCDLTLGLTNLSKEPGKTSWSMFADERFTNPAGTIQGGFLAALIDSAMGASAVTYVQGRKVYAANSDLSVRFLRPARMGTQLTCVAEVVAGGRSVLHLEATVSDSQDRVIARGSSTYHLIPREER